MEDSEEAMTPWSIHQPGYEEFDVPENAEPISKEAMLEYLAFCRRIVAERVPQLDLEGPERHCDKSLMMLELQIYSIRHIMQHAGELMERLAARTGAEIDWMGWVHA